MKDYATEKIVKRYKDPEEQNVSDAIAHLIGSKIVGAGFIDKEMEGGLVIDYELENAKHRLVLGYNELGEWVKFHDIIETHLK